MKQNKICAGSGLRRSLQYLSLLLQGGLLAALIAILGGCAKPDGGDGGTINQLALPTDVVLDLSCENVGIHPENCVLADPNNPFVAVTIEEFNTNEPDAPFNKFELANAITAGPAGAKARFYFWATALARFPSGENQYYTAQALHELFDANSNDVSQDELVRAQALKAYRSVLDNFFGTVTVFTCCANLSDDGEPVAFPVLLRALTADALYRTDRTGFRRLIAGDPLLVLEQLLDWGYTYQPATAENNFDDGVVEIIQGP